MSDKKQPTLREEVAALSIKFTDLQGKMSQIIGKVDQYNVIEITVTNGKEKQVLYRTEQFMQMLYDKLIFLQKIYKDSEVFKNKMRITFKDIASFGSVLAVIFLVLDRIFGIL